MDDPDTEWDGGAVPNFDAVNKLYLKGRTRFHLPGSLEKTVENLVKTWEVESTHKNNPKVRTKLPNLKSYNSFLLLFIEI